MKIYDIFKSGILAIFLLLIVSCANLGDSSTDLGSGYVYSVDGDQRWMRPGNILQDGIYPNVIDYKFSNDYILVIQEPNVKGYKRFLSQDLRFKYESIIYKAVAPETDAYANKFLKSHLWTDSSIHTRVTREIRPDNQASFERLDLIADSIVKFDRYIKSHFVRKRNYWIILKKKNIVLGPYSKPEYQRQRTGLKIPKSLQLEE